MGDTRHDPIGYLNPFFVLLCFEGRFIWSYLELGTVPRLHRCLALSLYVHIVAAVYGTTQ